MSASTLIAEAVAPPAISHRLRECHDCGLMQFLPSLPRGATARCGRCGATLRRRRPHGNGRALAFSITGLTLFVIAISMPFIALDLQGKELGTHLVSGPEELDVAGLWELALAVLVTSVLAPAAKLGMMIYVLIGVRLPRPPRHLAVVFRWVEQVRPWAMIEVFLLGVFVAYTKLVDIAHVEVGIAVYALGALMLTMAAADSMLDDETVWAALERKGVVSVPAPPAAGGRRVGCECCGLVSRGVHACPRCGAALHARKPNSLSRAWAFLFAAAVLYIPANLLPVMTVISFGQGSPSTIFSGVVELAQANMWPLAALVFFASITVPVLKMIGLVYLLVSAGRRSTANLRRRTTIYRLVEGFGRWSMIDVFMISILTALVRLGAIATILPGPGAIAFCSVVILTMLSAMSFDPRLMWDALDERPAP